LASGLWLIGRLPESPQAALPNNNDNYYAHKDEYFADYRICDQSKHLPAVGFKGFFLIQRIIQLYVILD